MIPILYEDKDFVVVHKPSNMPSQKDFSRTLDVVTSTKTYLGFTPFLVHRLDRHVSGPMILAKSKEAAAKMNQLVSGRNVYKEYRCVVVGKAKEEEHLTHYLKKEKSLAHCISKEMYDSLKSGSKDDYKKCELIYQKLDSKMLNNTTLSLLKVELLTGRFHQIRAQLAERSLPILGDPKYGVVTVEGYKSSKIGLQSTALRWKHPINGEDIEIECSHNEEPFDLFRKDSPN